MTSHDENSRKATRKTESSKATKDEFVRILETHAGNCTRVSTIHPTRPIGNRTGGQHHKSVHPRMEFGRPTRPPELRCYRRIHHHGARGAGCTDTGSGCAARRNLE